MSTAAGSTATGTTRMRAWRFDILNGLDDLTLHEEPMPRPQHSAVLVTSPRGR